MTPAQITEELHALADNMHKLAVQMEYYGGFGNNYDRGNQLLAVSRVIAGWVAADKLQEFNGGETQ